MTTRIRLTRAQKVRLFDRHGGRCHVCGLKIQVGQCWEVEHVVPLADGGSDTQDNMAPAHRRPCHRGKTNQEATDRAKVFAVRANHLLIEKPGPKLPAGRNSGIKKKITGEVVPRLKEKGSEHRRVMEQFPNRRGE